MFFLFQLNACVYMHNDLIISKLYLFYHWIWKYDGGFYKQFISKTFVNV